MNSYLLYYLLYRRSFFYKHGLKLRIVEDWEYIYGKLELKIVEDWEEYR